MYKHYLKVTYRNLLKNKGYAVINIGGLAVGMAVAMLIGLWVRDELSFNEFHEKHDQIAQVMQNRTVDGQKETQAIVPIPLEDDLRSRYGNDFKHLVTAFWNQQQILSAGNKKYTMLGNYMGKEAVSLFSLHMLEGTKDGLTDPGSILLSESTAQAFFGKEKAMGKLMKINNEMSAMVTGVYEDLPKNSSLYGLEFIAPWELFVSSQDWIKNARAQNTWDIGAVQLFVQLADHAKMEEVSEKIKMVADEHLGEFEKAYDPQFSLHPMNDWHLRSNWQNGIKTGGLIQFVWLFGMIGVFVLFLAVINFMNLSTAQSENRSKEVGIRKSIGSLRSQLIRQFLTESYLVVFLSFVLSMIIVVLAIPYFNELAAKDIRLPVTSFPFWLASLGFLMFTGLLAGSYPALYLSSFRPVDVLKGTFSAGNTAMTFRRVLVVLQFTVSVSLIIGTMVVQKQIHFTKDRPMGFNVNNVIMIWSNSPDFKGKFELLRTALKRNQAIVEMSEASSPLTGIFSHDGNFSWEGKDPAAQVEFATIRVTPNFGKTAAWEMIAGRDFSREYLSDSTAIILNKTAVKYMGFDDPIGKMIVWGKGEAAGKFNIIGVINDMLMESPYQAIPPTIYTIGKTHMDCMTMRLNPAKSTEESLALVKEVFREYLPAMPFDYRFVDQEHALKFATEERIGALSSIFAILAIFISCLGLFGLASFVAEQRTREIGIRKILGASIFGIWKMISTDFVVLVFISCVVATPIAYYMLNGWLQHFEYRTDLHWSVFLAAAAAAILITLLTVSFHAIRSATSNPLKNLRAE
ncbi:MAG: FtsX-like permease family protein [Saprospiraceae bacterium]